MGFDSECKEALLEMRDKVLEIERRMSHIVEQNRLEKLLLYGPRNDD